MRTFTVHTPDSAPEGSKARLAEVTKAWGFLPHLHAILAESPVALEAYDSLFGLVGRSTLTPAEQQVAYLAVNVMHECEYCTAGHTYLARAAQLDEAAIQSLRNGTALANPRLQALRAFTERVVSTRGQIGDEAVAAFLAAGFSKANVLEVVTIVATKTISNYVNHITHTPLEGFMADPALHWVAPSRRSTAVPAGGAG
jgi:uncharacterized peroxidase-related enzyme